jgi:hypothetical protein
LTPFKPDENRYLSGDYTLLAIPSLATSTLDAAEIPTTSTIQGNPASLANDELAEAKENPVTYDDDWADIEAWLYSEAVKIVPDREW